MLFRDRCAHAYTRHLMKTEARLSREAWVRSTDASDLVRGEVMSLRTTVLGQMTEIRKLHAADRRRQIVISEMLMADHRRSTKIIELRTTIQGHNTGRVYTAASGEKKQYGGSKPLCAKCNYHHDGSCALKCHNCNKVGHFARDCRNTANTNNANNQKGTGLGQKAICYECGVQGNFKRECPKLKNNNNHGNQGGRNNALARVYAVGRVETDPDTNVVMEKYMMKGFHIFLAHITTKEIEDKSEKK
nr:hypothetical protein [Tanacetum cinerariifolium]